jgi:hypothetical protein
MGRERRLQLIAGTRLTAAAHELQRRVVLEERSARDCWSNEAHGLEHARKSSPTIGEMQDR